MKYCKKCVMPDTRPKTEFKDGVCEACSSSEQKQNIDWEARKLEFESIIQKHKAKKPHQYDCVIPVSGGKDSTYQTYVIKEIYKLNPLCVCFEPTLPTEIGLRNISEGL